MDGQWALNEPSSGVECCLSSEVIRGKELVGMEGLCDDDWDMEEFCMVLLTPLYAPHHPQIPRQPPYTPRNSSKPRPEA